ncbi:MAG: N-acetylmuramoyl-L-alanine amidase [Campylobacteraceae bacterium]|jgi:N-acetylmuramoyl-L-alanine amidase|nr:N-acetylmuramoyl-L-alanine amidase [Campylobacteraceae bacterium]
MLKRVFTFIFLLISFVCAQNAVFNEFDGNFSIYSQNEKERVYDNLKYVYIKSIMDTDDILRYEVLNRLISGGKKLNYDVSVYEKELDELLKNQNIVDAIQKKSDKLSNNFANNTPINTVDTASVAQTAKPQQTKEQNTSSMPFKLLQVKKTNDNVIFVFDRELEKKEIKFFTLKEKSVRYIYDIKGIKTNFAIDFKIEGVKDFRISQFDKEKIRVVFEHEKEIDITYELKGTELIFAAKEFSPVSAKKGDETVNTTNTLPVKIALTKKTIVIDAGHGGKDGGAVSNKKLEKDAVLQIALLLGAELEKRGHKVFYTRSKDVYLKLQDRTKTANDRSADLFISIHANAAPKNSKNGNWQGIETFFLSPSDSARSKNAAELENQSDIEEMNLYSRQTFLNFLNREKIIASHKLAIDIQQHILTEVKKSYTKVVDGGVREAPFWVLTGAQMPAVLLEVGYITNKTDRERMFDKKFQQTLIKGISNGIESYFAKNM